MNLSQQRQ